MVTSPLPQRSTPQFVWKPLSTTFVASASENTDATAHARSLLDRQHQKISTSGHQSSPTYLPVASSLIFIDHQFMFFSFIILFFLCTHILCSFYPIIAVPVSLISFTQLITNVLLVLPLITIKTPALTRAIGLSKTGPMEHRRSHQVINSEY